jgi:EAL domain-containing protein (putative c-di-GMP-specific phosphodiesterase class I)
VDGARVRGAEGLVRWQHPELGLIGPGDFIQTVEQSGLIGPPTRHVLERSISECATARRESQELSVAVNCRRATRWTEACPETSRRCS